MKVAPRWVQLHDPPLLVTCVCCSPFMALWLPLLQETKTVPACTPDIKACLVLNIRRRMTPQPLKIRADVELKCFHYDGVLHIKVGGRGRGVGGPEEWWTIGWSCVAGWLAASQEATFWFK